MATSRREIRWERDPFAGCAPLDQVVKIEAGPPREFVILSYRLAGVWTHFLDGRTGPCYADNCPGCQEGVETSRRWQGWLAVCLPARKIVQFLALTDGAVRDLPAIIAPAGPQGLRARGILVGRRGNTPRGKMVCHFSLATYEEKSYPQAPDVETFLARLWGLHKSGEAKPLNDYRTLEVARPKVAFKEATHRPGGGAASEMALGQDIFRDVGLNWEEK